jgi:hypothetical protein
MDTDAKQPTTDGESGYDTARIEDEVFIDEDPDGLDESKEEDDDRADVEDDVPFDDGRDDFSDEED